MLVSLRKYTETLQRVGVLTDEQAKAVLAELETEEFNRDLAAEVKEFRKNERTWPPSVRVPPQQ